MNTMQGNTVPDRVAIGFEKRDRDARPVTGCQAGVTGGCAGTGPCNFFSPAPRAGLLNAAARGQF
jgi:hypothetical protein